MNTQGWKVQKNELISHNFDTTSNNAAMDASSLCWEVLEQPSGSDRISQAHKQYPGSELPKEANSTEGLSDMVIERTPKQAKH